RGGNPGVRADGRLLLPSLPRWLSVPPWPPCNFGKTLSALQRLKAQGGIVNHPPQPLHLTFAVLCAGLIVLAPGALRAAPPPASYKIQSIFKLGDKIGDITTDSKGDVEIGALNDNGQIVFVTENAAAGAGELLVQYSDGKFTPIVVGGGTAPGGTWSKP